MESLKDILAFIICIVWVFATIGSVAYLFYYGLPHFAVASLAVSAMAFPYVREQAGRIIKFNNK